MTNKEWDVCSSYRTKIIKNILNSGLEMIKQKELQELQELQKKLKEEALRQLEEAELLLETMDHRFNSPELFAKVNSHIDWLRQIVDGALFREILVD